MARAKKPGLHGIEIQAAQKWLLNLLLKKADLGPPPMPRSEDPSEFGGGSENMKLAFCVCWWVHAVRSGAGMEIARKRLMARLGLERLAHQLSEPTPPSHDQVHLGPMGAALLVARESGDDEIAQMILDWQRPHYNLVNACRVTIKDRKGRPTPTAHMAGGRGFRGPKGARKPFGSNETWWKYLATIRSGRTPGEPNSFDVGAHCLERALTAAERRTIQEPPEAYPPTWRPLRIRRYPNGDFWMTYDEPGWPDATLSAGSLSGELWIGAEIDHEKIAAYSPDSGAVLRIDTPPALFNADGKLVNRAA